MFFESSLKNSHYNNLDESCRSGGDFCLMADIEICALSIASDIGIAMIFVNAADQLDCWWLTLLN